MKTRAVDSFVDQKLGPAKTIDHLRAAIASLPPAELSAAIEYLRSRDDGLSQGLALGLELGARANEPAPFLTFEQRKTESAWVPFKALKVSYAPISVEAFEAVLREPGARALTSQDVKLAGKDYYLTVSGGQGGGISTNLFLNDPRNAAARELFEIKGDSKRARVVQVGDALFVHFPGTDPQRVVVG